MSDTHDTNATPEPKRLGLLAQFEGPDELIAAAERVTDDGYKKVEAFSPFAIIGIDDALKAKGTILPFISLVMGMTGCLVGLGMQLYCNGLEGPWWLSGYAFQISAKPGFSSIPAFIPVTFECIILLSAFGAFFGMLILNQLPKLSNPLFRNEGFARATDDGFFLFIESDDAKYADAETGAYLTSIGATSVEPIDEIAEGHTLPGVIHLVGAVTATAALLIPLYIWMSSSTTSSVPRISLFKDMESQAKFKAQTASSVFGDVLSPRKPITGTVARGGLRGDTEFYEGVESDSNLTGFFGSDSLRFASREARRIPARFASDDADDQGDDGEAPAAAPEDEAANERNWIKDFPESLTVNEELMDRGQQRYNIHCAACHGLAGNGDGLVSKRAMKVSGATWTPPTSLHVEAVVTQPVGRVFDTISNGRRKMPGYASHITPEDRWAIVLYIQALQRSQNASADDLPAEKRRAMEDRS
ncbi:Cytochrome c [Planctomycetes bacterium MalM25]|nr:Cytochrome c [Planctomycetes bacterium MalM25]